MSVSGSHDATIATFALMRISGFELHREHSIEQQHTACSPLREIAVIGHYEWWIHCVTRELFVDVLQTRRCGNAVLY